MPQHSRCPPKTALCSNVKPAPAVKTAVCPAHLDLLVLLAAMVNMALLANKVCPATLVAHHRPATLNHHRLATPAHLAHPELPAHKEMAAPPDLLVLPETPVKMAALDLPDPPVPKEMLVLVVPTVLLVKLVLLLNPLHPLLVSPVPLVSKVLLVPPAPVETPAAMATPVNPETRDPVETMVNPAATATPDPRDLLDPPAHKVNAVFAPNTALWMAVSSSKMARDVVKRCLLATSLQHEKEHSLLFIINFATMVWLSSSTTSDSVRKTV